MASPLCLSSDILLTEYVRTLVGKGVWERCAGFQPHCQASTGVTTTQRLSGLVLTGIRGSMIRVPPGHSLYCCGILGGDQPPWGLSHQSLELHHPTQWPLHIWWCVCMLSCVRLFPTPWTIAVQAPLSSTISQSLLKFMSSELVMLSNHPILCLPLLLLPSILSGSFPMSRLFASDSQSMGASASVLPMNVQGWFPLGLTGLISLQSKGLSRVFSSTTVQKHQFFGAQPSLWSNSHIRTWLLEKP